MKDILNHLFQYKKLTREQAKGVLIEIAQGKYNNEQISSFLTAFIMRSITLEELSGFRDGLLSLCNRVDLSEHNPMDLCGTGGDGQNTFNISTLSSFIVAGAGVPVAKHGNYGVSSISGSSNVLMEMGIQFHTEEERLKEQIQEANICFLHAPLFHPAMKAVGAIRKQLKVRTFFNMLGPLVNPTQPKVQLVGVFNLELARLYQYLFQNLNTTYCIVHALDGYDEISLTCDAKAYNNRRIEMLNPAYFGFEKISPESIYGGSTVKESAQIFDTILHGKGTDAQNQVVLANSAMAIKTYKNNLTIEEAKEEAKESLLGLKALQSFNTLKKLS